MQKLSKTGDEETAGLGGSGRSLVRAKPTSVSMRETGRILHAGMISSPQNDFRHTLHVGYDGSVFGDASFLGPSHMTTSQIGISRPFFVDCFHWQDLLTYISFKCTALRMSLV